ncbi:MAG: methylated-DNA--protein-cysteine methyltransferase [Actinomycetota bacterium]|nr:MAG: methylated-DNA--protein-cysteine methyltransferase [Actinomycetota bacterium]
MAPDLSPSAADPGAGSLAGTSLPTPLGPLAIVSGPGGIVAAGFGPLEPLAARVAERLDRPVVRDDRRLARARAEAQAFLAGERSSLRSPVDLALVGGAFARAVLEATRRIPYGALATYGDVAAAAGRPQAWRAAGTALRRCPIELWVPCHRVVPAGPSLGDYGGRPEVRRFLLRLEGSLPPGD